MSFNFEKKGLAFGVIEGGKDNKKVVSITDQETIKSFNRLDLTDGKFQHIPNENNPLGRTIGYLTAPSGAGKSTYVYNYCKEWQKKNKDKPIYLFSALGDDPSLDKLKPARIKIDEDLITNPIKADEFDDGSMVIFDDVDCISNKKIRESIYKTMNQVLEVGRHYKLHCLITNHLPTMGHDGKRIINECHFVVYFPKSGANGVGLKRLLCDYLGLDINDIKKIKKMNTRWATVFKQYPNFIMTERSCFTLDED
jgi:hypothetical protein